MPEGPFEMETEGKTAPWLTASMRGLRNLQYNSSMLDSAEYCCLDNSYGLDVGFGGGNVGRKSDNNSDTLHHLHGGRSTSNRCQRTRILLATADPPLSFGSAFAQLGRRPDHNAAIGKFCLCNRIQATTEWSWGSCKELILEDLRSAFRNNSRSA